MLSVTAIRGAAGAAMLAFFFPVAISNALAQSADETGRAQPPIADIEPLVVTATRIERALSDAPGSLQAINRRDFIDIGAQTLDDVLETAVGLNPTGNPGRVGSASIRGTGTGRTLFLIDGRRVANGFRDTIDLGRVLLPAVDRIEVYRGPSSALYGSDAIGGVINLITRKPDRTGAEVEGRYDFGRADGYQASVVGAYSSDRITALATAALISQEEFDDDTVASLSEVDDTGIVNGLAQLEYRFNDWHSVSLGGSLARFDREGLRPVQGLERTRDSDDLRAEAFLRYDGGDGADLSWFAQANYSRFEADIVFDPTFDGVDTGETSDLVQAEGQFNWRLGGRSVLSVGGDIRGESLNEADAGVDEAITNSGGFVQLDLWLADNLNLLAGLRGDYHSEFGGHLAPRSAIIWSPSETLRVRASYGQGFKAPTLSELNVTQLRRRGREIVEANINLEPETSHGFDVGVEGEFGIVQTNLIGFYNIIDDRIDEVLVRIESGGMGGGGMGGGGMGGGGMGGGGRTTSIFERANITEITTRGVELQVGLTLPHGFFVRGNAAYLDTQVEETGAPLPGEPEWRGFAKAGWQSADQRIRTAVSASFAGETTTAGGDPVSSAALVNIYTEYSVTGDLGVYGGVDNLTDKRDAENLFTPRQFFAGLRYRL